MTMPPEMIEAVARAVAPHMEGGREYDQMPPDRIALRKWRREGMCSFNDATQDDAREAAEAAIRTLAPMMAEVMAEVIDTHKPDASFDDSGAGALERNALLDNVAAEVRAKGKELADG